MQSLPPEILSRIFLECLSRNCFPPPAKSEAPLLLARVCSYWRSVALSTRDLWTGIGLGERYPNFHDWEKDAISAEQWRNRAGPSSGLSYKLYFNPDYNGDSWVDLMNAIIPQHQWWRRIQGLLPPSIAKQILSVISHRGAPMLEYLNIHTRYANDPQDIDLSTMPRLQKLVLNTNEPIIEFGACGSQSLREVIIDKLCYTITLDECWMFISRCPNLEVFQTICYPHHAFTFHEVDILRHARLTYFHLEAIAPDPGPFLDKLEAPELKFMALQYHNNLPVDNGQGWPHLTSFLNRSKCQLMHLVFAITRMSENDIVNCFQAAPALKSLCMESYPVMTSATIAALNSQPLNFGNDTLCLELESLCFHKCLHCSPKALEDMILSRCAMTTRKLRKVALYGCDFAELLDKPRMVRCIEEGLQLVNGPSNSYERQCRTHDPLTVGWTE